MDVQGCLDSVSQYSSPKYVRIQSPVCGCVQIVFYATLALSICCIVFIHRLYQETDEINSSVRTSVKGVAYTNNRIWDTAEYAIPVQGVNSFFVMTNIITTENQIEHTCPEYPFVKAICSSDKSCEKGSVDIHSHGIKTGRCVNYNATTKTCEVRAWCPVESMESPPKPAVLRSSEDFTVLIKNNIHFPKFDYSTLNFPPNVNTSCTYNKITSPFCPVFRLGDILQEAKENFSEVAVKGGIIAIEINWDCNLDRWFYNCRPKYGFYRLDDRKTTPGLHFRYARYYKLPDGREQRTLFKVYGIRFDVLVFGTGRKFNAIELIKNLGSMISYIGLVAWAIEFVLWVGSYSHFGKSSFYKIFNRKKFETMLDPRQVLYVSYIDEPHVTLIKMPLKTSLQHAEGSIVESHPVKFCDAGSWRTSESNENHDNEESELGQPLRQRVSSPDGQKWCCCGKCRPTPMYHEQLCCRRKKGQCITTSYGFQQLVLSRDTLKKALLYKDPFMDLMDDDINNKLRHLAYKQYIHWHFSCFDLEDRAVIPNCCRWKIRDTYPKAVHNYTGFNME
ncbi:P2X purinoceptor 7 isoform X1 [Falco peregrinus]|uniref:P2X purinoceptor 7 isoform X1 n=1 Tax=Falco peregrinus TaxID=8954 RepID=UPI0006786973|nr:P2X purinoceptor 7 isoform X1 [Falco peregrinus]